MKTVILLSARLFGAVSVALYFHAWLMLFSAERVHVPKNILLLYLALQTLVCGIILAAVIGLAYALPVWLNR